MTLHRHWPEVEKMLITVDSFATPRSLWHTDPEFSRRMLSEWDKIELYKARGFIAEWPASGEGDRSRIDLFRRIEIFFLRAQHSRQRTQAGVELIHRRRGQRQPHRVGCVPGRYREGRGRRQRDVAAGGGGDEGLRAPVRRQRQPEMIGFGVGLDFETGEAFRRDLLTPAGIDAFQS